MVAINLVLDDVEMILVNGINISVLIVMAIKVVPLSYHIPPIVQANSSTVPIQVIENKERLLLLSHWYFSNGVGNEDCRHVTISPIEQGFFNEVIFGNDYTDDLNLLVLIY